jgi:NAD-dependent dihydropyrimidine dehydrogenase PreA subunit
MWGFIKNSFAVRRDHADCSGCSLCMLVCPVWRKTSDISLTPHGRAKAMQQGDVVDATAVENCTLCMACNPVCPENIDLVGMILNLRRKQVPLSTNQELRVNMAERAAHPRTLQATSSMMLLPDAALRAHPETLARITNLLGAEKIVVSEDAGADISLALEAGADILAQRLKHFLVPLRQMKKIIVADGLLLRHLKQWLPKIGIISVGEALSSHSNVRRSLRASDLYVIEPRAYHSDYQRLVKHYDRLRANHGCSFNLDLQRIAIPATTRSLPQRLGLIVHDDDAQARWVLHGRNITRIVVESLEDCAAVKKVSDIPVVHLAELADDDVPV